MTIPDRILRGAALAAMVALVAGPVRAFLLSPTSPIALTLAWGAGVGVAWVRPAWGAWLLVGLVPCLPALPYLVPGVPYGVVHLVVVGLALPALVRIVRGQGSPAADPVGLTFTLVAFVALVSLGTSFAAYYLASPVSAAAFADLGRLVDGYIFAPIGPHLTNGVVAASTFVDGLLAYLIVRTGVERAAVRRLLHVAVGAAVVVSGLGFVQAMTGTALHPMWIQYDAGIRRINSTYSDPNALAAYLAMLLPVTVALAGAADESGQRWAWLGGATMLGVALILTAGRMAVGAALVGLAILVVEVLRRDLDLGDPWSIVRRAYRRGVVGVGVALVAGIVVLSAIGTARDMRHSDQDSYLDTALYTLNLRQPLDEKLKGRLTIWRTTLRMFADAPIFGIGIGRVFEAYPDYSARTGGFGAGLSLSAHNTFINVAAETGLAGLGVWLALLGVVLATALARGPGDTRPVAWVRVGLAAGLGAYGTTMLTGDRTILREDPVMFGAIVATAVLLAPSTGGWASRAPRVAMAVGAILLLTLPMRAADAARVVELDQVDWGFHGIEIDSEGQPFRWTRRWAALHVPASAREITIPVRSPDPWRPTVTVTLDGRTADRFVLDEPGWRSLQYALPADDARGRFHRIELAVDPTVVVPGDGRELGVIVGAHDWRPAAGAVP